MTLRNKSAFMEALWDWDFLMDVLVVLGSAFSDLDVSLTMRSGAIHRGKSRPGKEVSIGQFRMFRSWPPEDHGSGDLGRSERTQEEAMIWAPGKRLPGKKMKADADRIKEIGL